MEKIAIGNIRTSYGVKGYLKVRSYSGETKHFLKLKELVIKKAGKEVRLTIQDIKKRNDELLVKFNEINSPEEGKKYSNWEIWVERKNAAPLKRGEFYHQDLSNCSIEYKGEVLGKVEAVCDGGLYDLLEVKKNDGTTVMVPFHNEYLGKIDIKAGRIELKVSWIIE